MTAAPTEPYPNFSVSHLLNATCITHTTADIRTITNAFFFEIRVISYTFGFVSVLRHNANFASSRLDNTRVTWANHSGFLIAHIEQPSPYPCHAEGFILLCTQ
ncbi:unnamed protein product, partial [Vitis vinifera]|uniref:Uncharacterized protein n=1 Tax=Vitis vinifera TaxID=29760 RepID=D7TGT3_VITVI